MLHTRVSLGVLLMLLPACSAESEPASGDPYQPATLEAYRQAIPAQARLVASVPTAEDVPGALTVPGNAVLAGHGIDFARSVNQPARALVAALRTITDLPPTRFDARGSRFIWGPWANEHGVGQVALVLSRNEPGADFEYAYALVRTPDGDLDGASAIIAGGATPDPENADRGVGVALWDLEANRAFDMAHDPAHVEADASQGRFVMLFGHHAGDAGDACFNVAVFRGFVPESESAAPGGSAPLDIDYFYGRFHGHDGTRIDFVDSEVFADLCATSADSCFDVARARGADERFEYQAYFVNAGLGRAEATLRDGDLPGPVRMVECWNPGLNRTSFQIETNGEMVEMMENGSCTAPTDQSATRLGLPTLADIDPAMLGALSCAAENGLIGCE